MLEIGSMRMDILSPNFLIHTSKHAEETIRGICRRNHAE